VKAVDTNVLARFVLNDDSSQAELAAGLLQSPCYASDTVLLETAWLLSSRYGFDRATVSGTLRDLIRLPALSISDPPKIAWAIDRFEAGADFADMLHLATASVADSFATFDQRLARQAGPDTPLRIETLT
jgi:predicted nucleic-acid-binding protein